MSDYAPLIAIELLLVFGGTMAFAWWQLRELKKLRQEREQREQREREEEARKQPDAARAPATHPADRKNT